MAARHRTCMQLERFDFAPAAPTRGRQDHDVASAADASRRLRDGRNCARWPPNPIDTKPYPADGEALPRAGTAASTSIACASPSAAREAADLREFCAFLAPFWSPSSLASTGTRCCALPPCSRVATRSEFSAVWERRRSAPRTPTRWRRPSRPRWPSAISPASRAGLYARAATRSCDRARDALDANADSAAQRDRGEAVCERDRASTARPDRALPPRLCSSPGRPALAAHAASAPPSPRCLRHRPRRRRTRHTARWSRDRPGCTSVGRPRRLFPVPAGTAGFAESIATPATSASATADVDVRYPAAVRLAAASETVRASDRLRPRVDELQPLSEERSPGVVTSPTRTPLRRRHLSTTSSL